MSMQTLGRLRTIRSVCTDLMAALASGKIQGALVQEEILSLPLAYFPKLALRLALQYRPVYCGIFGGWFGAVRLRNRGNIHKMG